MSSTARHPRFAALSLALLGLACLPQNLQTPRPDAGGLAAPSSAAPSTAESPPVVTAPAAGESASAAALLARLVEGATLEPDPALPEPKRRPADGDDHASPTLSGRTEDGKTVLEFPLRHTKVRAEVSGNVARVEVQQLYLNPSSDRLEAVYAFPLPANAAVTDMYFRIGKRVVYSEVKRKEEARQTYETAKREGRTAALTEQERPNLFTQSVANIPPGESVAVVLRYVHEVPYDDGRYLFVFPTTIGPRYIPGTPTGKSGPGWAADTDRVDDASRVTPPVVGPAYRSAHEVDLQVRLLPGKAFREVGSKNHRVVSGLDGEGARLVGLAEDDRVPNKDFVLAYRPAGAMPQAHALVQRERGEDYLMLFVQPPAEVPQKLVRPKELVFLLDKSGSMSGAPLETARRLVMQSLRQLGPDDTFQIVAFDGAATSMSASPLPNSPANVAAADSWMEGLSGGGGTEMLTGILAALEPAADPRRLRMVVFCTDGFIGNEREIIAAVAERRGSARVFGFGVGSSVNRYLVEGVGRAGRGTSEVVGWQEDPEEAVTRLFKRLDKPVLTDLSVRFEGVTVTELQPEHLPDLFAGQPLVVAGRYHGGGAGAVVLEGRLGLEPWSQRIPVEVQADASGQPVTGTLWARRRIEELMTRESGGPYGGDAEEIARLGLRFKLVTQYTSFVAVERELLADPGLPLTQVIVPNELPEGVSAEGIFGEGASQAQVLPARVKPGDPEVRVRAAASVESVEVTLPFGEPAREAVWDAASGEFVLRFLVPPGWPDGSYQARIALRHRDGREELRQAAIKVDTTPAAVAVVWASANALPGERVELRLKPALALGRLAQLASGDQPAESLKGAMEVKEILVRAPWGEVQVAQLDGALGTYRAQLTVPEDWAHGPAQLEIVASDAAGNVTRRHYAVQVGAAEASPAAALALLALSLGLVVLALRGARFAEHRSAEVSR